MGRKRADDMSEIRSKEINLNDCLTRPGRCSTAATREFRSYTTRGRRIPLFHESQKMISL